MQGQRFFKFASDGVSGGESADFGIILPCSEVILVNLGIEVLAGERKGVIYCFFFFVVEDLAERLIEVAVLYVAGGIHYQPDAAESVL